MVVLNNETLTQETNTDDVPPNTETKTENDDNTVEDNTVENNRQSPVNLNFIYDNDKDITENIKLSKKHTLSLENINSKNLIEELHNNAHDIDPDSDRLCSWIQIITACFSSFAHGSNDVANAIAPLATIYYIYKNDSFGDSLEVPVWVLLIGGLGIVLGLVTWGYKIIDRIGKELTKITPSRGFIIELSAALTVIIASRAEIPVSTTHCQVGSVLGCGMGGGLNNIDWKLVKGILFSWLVTLPFTGILSAALFSYGYYSPNSVSCTSGFFTNSCFSNTKFCVRGSCGWSNATSCDPNCIRGGGGSSYGGGFVQCKCNQPGLWAYTGCPGKAPGGGAVGAGACGGGCCCGGVGAMGAILMSWDN